MIVQISPVNFTASHNIKEHKARQQKPKKIKNKGWFPAMFAPVVAGKAVLYSNKFLSIKHQNTSVLSSEETTAVKEGIQKSLENLKNKGLDIKVFHVAERSERMDVFKLMGNLNENLDKGGDIKKLFQNIPLVAPENKRAFIEYVKTCENLESPYKKVIQNKLINAYGRLIEKAFDLDKGSISDSPQVKRMVKRFNYAPFFNQVEKGINAFSFSKFKKIFMPMNKLLLLTFHEQGHILTYQSTLGKLLQNVKPIAKIGGLITILSIFGKKREETPEKKLKPWHKTVNFVRNNAGKLMFASAIPILADEALASINANKIAKKVLSPQLLKKMNRNNMWAYSTYFLQALGVTVSVFAAVKVKDYFQDKHADKVNAFNENLKLKQDSNQNPNLAPKQDPPKEQTIVEKPLPAMFDNFKM